MVMSTSNTPSAVGGNASPSSTNGTHEASGPAETVGAVIPTSTPTAGIGDILAHVQKVWDGIRPNSAIYRLLLSELRWVSASHGRIVVHMRLQPVHLNSKRTLHGSVSATIVDWAGGMAIASTGLHKTGVSTDIHVSYVSAAKDNDMIEIEAWVSRVGRSLAYTMVEIRKVGDDAGRKGPVVCTASHTKYLAV